MLNYVETFPLHIKNKLNVLHVTIVSNDLRVHELLYATDKGNAFEVLSIKRMFYHSSFNDKHTNCLKCATTFHLHQTVNIVRFSSYLRNKHVKVGNFYNQR